jgi:hypothetical protein
MMMRRGDRARGEGHRSLGRARRLALATALATLVAVAGACGEPQDPSLVRLWTSDFEIRVTSDVSPPRALERITYTVVVLDKETQEPVVNGEGRIFATNADGKDTDNGFTYGPEVGTYRTMITFVTAGEWAVGLQFRRDSTLPLQRTMDWRQMVRNEIVPSPSDSPGAPRATPIQPPTKTP